ncbi:recombinase family protein [Sphingomonas asaccharolytica]|uniref:recombinase family protein n=1 Tax=Sphingomonas asaccharolytica TaxID=40681 RepID=UPI00082D0FEE|nr:recombinase family protein [Sphingomonas asaccharolytica]
MKQVRCAIYTRKSSEEGLEQDFNSLDAQREACSAYILSQASEGWAQIPDRYDDGGLSGGTLERPGLKRLLADVADGKIDIIVVYKVDRLTRSLLDFSKLVEAFDKAGTSFVSVTQSFNTTTSMGRLTLNMLLSFAQFEREVTAERIRDKIAASKAKGMWMGGIPPLGYEPEGRSLKIVDAHADLVRDIFDRYLRLGNVRHVAEELARDGIVSPVRIKAKSGVRFGGVPLSRGQIYGILKCPTYVGEVHHKGQVYQGTHDAIVTRDVWEQVQKVLANNLQGRRSGGAGAETPSLLAGKVVDAAAIPLIPVHACKGKVRYRYYVSRELQHGTAKIGMRIPAREIETAVVERLGELFDNTVALMSMTGMEFASHDLAALAERAGRIKLAIRAREPVAIRRLVDRASILDGRIEIACSTEAIAEMLGLSRQQGGPLLVTLNSDVRLTRAGKAMLLVQSNGAAVSKGADVSLIGLLIKARRWWTQLRQGEMDVTTLAHVEGVHSSYLTRVLRLAFLAPAVVDAILTGTTLPYVDGRLLTLGEGIDPAWAAQRAALLPT